jgi:hypothetical protein
MAAAAERVGDVVRLISDIAGQTNLLASYLKELRYFNQIEQSATHDTRVIPMILWG